MNQSTINNRTIFGSDNLDIMGGINSDSLNLIYLDPPFNKKKVFTAPIGSSAEGASFIDIFRQEDIKDEWILTIKEDQDKLYGFLNGIKVIEGRTSYNYCYLSYMAIRLIECHRILKDSGSIYLHCDPTMSHYLKILLDCIFGEKNFRNEIVWCYSHGGKGKRDFARKHDIILRYVKSDNYIFNAESVSVKRDTGVTSKGGRIGKDKKGRPYQDKIVKKTGKIYRYYLDIGKIPEDYWKDINSLQAGVQERTGYPTQKPLALLERIIKASSNEGDVILDPFCGCATTCVAAEKLNRQWIGIDVSVKAYELVKIRLQKEVADPQDLFKKDNVVTYSQSIPKRTDVGHEVREQKWVYVISNSMYPNEYKVGIAKDWKSRLNSYQTSDPNRGYNIEYKVLTHKFRELEKYIHNTFENKHEWVNACIKEIKKEMNDFNKQQIL